MTLNYHILLRLSLTVHLSFRARVNVWWWRSLDVGLSPESMRFAKCIPERCHGCSHGFLISIYINTAFSCIYADHVTCSRYNTLCMNDFIVASLCPQDRYCAIQTSQTCWWLFTLTKF